MPDPFSVIRYQSSGLLYRIS